MGTPLAIVAALAALLAALAWFRVVRGGPVDHTDNLKAAAVMTGIAMSLAALAVLAPALVGELL